MRIPRLTSNVQEQAAPVVQIQPSATIENFGGGQAVAGVSQAFQGLDQQIIKIASEEKAKADDVATIDASAKLTQLKNDLFWNKDTGAMNKKGKDSFGVIDEYGKKFDDEAQKISDSLSNQDQKMMFNKLRVQQKTELNDNLQKHVFTESKAYDDQSTQSAIAASRDDAVLNYQNPDAVAKNIEMQKALITSHAQRNGLPEETLKQNLLASTSGTRSAVVTRMLDNGQYGDAIKYYNDNKADFSGQDAPKIEKQLEEGKTVVLGNDAWNKYSGLRLADGTPDEARIQRSIMADPALSDREKQKVWEFTKARASESIANKTRQDAANDRDFMNTMIKTRQAGTSLEDALKLSTKFGGDAYEQQTKVEAIKKMYAPPSESDIKVKYKLWEGVQEGTTSNAQIDEAMNKGLINSKDWYSLKEDRYKVEIEGKSPEMKSANDRIKQLAVEKFGSDQDKQHQFILEVNDTSRGKSPDEKWKIANDKLKDVPSGHWWTFDKPAYKVDAEKRANESLAFGKAQNDLGVEVLQSIKQGAAVKGNKQFTPQDLENFSQSLGGYNAIQKGTPTYNAIQSLMKKNKPVVPENIQAVLAKYPDGNF